MAQKTSASSQKPANQKPAKPTAQGETTTPAASKATGTNPATPQPNPPESTPSPPSKPPSRNKAIAPQAPPSSSAAQASTSKPATSKAPEGSPSPPAPSQRLSGETPPTSAIVVTVKAQPARSWWHRWRWVWQWVGLAILAMGWGILTHLAIAQLPPPAPVRLAQSILPQVAPVVERAFHGIYAWEANENLAAESDRTYRQRFGHLPYAESPPTELMVVSSYTAGNEQRFEQMEEAAGLALLEMIDAARLDGIWLVPISGFRTYDRQHLLFESKTDQVGSPEQAAYTVAPPGYSEHHTGMAVDLADGLARALDLSLAFGETEAYHWLSRYADQFGFELSFPPDNSQGISYEPWHWRYVGNDAAIATFAKGRTITDLDRERTVQ